MKFFNGHSLTGVIAVLVASVLSFHSPVDAKSSQPPKNSASKTGSAKDKSESATKTSTSKDKKKEISQKKKKPNKTKKSKAKKKRTTTNSAKAADSTVVKIDAADPKAFTKAILLEKKGVDFEIVEKKKNNKTIPIPKKPQNKDFIDFSDMLVPITHEALVGSPYGIRDHRLHRGVDVNVIKDEPVVAALPGKVIVSKYNKGGYGHYVLVEHQNGLQTLYGHLSARKVKVNDYVYPGDIVGLAGNTGKSSAAHLHFEIRYGEVNIDPTTIVNFPKWELQPGIEHVSKNKLIASHRKMQSKLSKENIYIVKDGDTQQDVATWFNISVEALQRINKLKAGAPLKVGQKLHGCK